MNYTTDLVHKTVKISLNVQILVGILSVFGFFITIPKDKEILKDVLKLDTFVQFIEFIFYLWMSYAVTSPKIMTSRRYIDWSITTPIMLISTIIYMRYENTKTSFQMGDFIKENKKDIIHIIIFNFLMLLLGFLGEQNILDKNISIIFGFYFFIKSFEIIKKYCGNSDKNRKLYIFLYIVWSLYGFAAMCKTNLKNISYNFLDIVAKNFYGLFILYEIYNAKFS